jgi:hypothetical protein
MRTIILSFLANIASFASFLISAYEHIIDKNDISATYFLGLAVYTLLVSREIERRND